MVDEFRTGNSVVNDAESAFMTLSHDLRLQILLALWDAPGFSLSFSDLRDAVDERDSGVFTYHLSELQGHFVAKTEDGYELDYPGHRVLDAIQSGIFHDRATVGPVDLNCTCRECGAQLHFGYGADYVGRIACPECGNGVLEWPFDPGGIVGRDPAEVVAAFERRTRYFWSCALDGVCPFCAGRIDPEFVHRVEREDDGGDMGEQEHVSGDIDHMYDREVVFEGQPVFVSVDCDQCSFYSFVPVGVVLLTHSEALERLHETSLDIQGTPVWDLGFVVDADAVSIRPTDPTSVTVTTVDADESLTFVVDESLEVTTESAR